MISRLGVKATTCKAKDLIPEDKVGYQKNTSLPLGQNFIVHTF